jgi:hypothetical protein
MIFVFIDPGIAGPRRPVVRNSQDGRMSLETEMEPQISQMNADDEAFTQWVIVTRRVSDLSAPICVI